MHKKSKDKLELPHQAGKARRQKWQSPDHRPNPKRTYARRTQNHSYEHRRVHQKHLSPGPQQALPVATPQQTHMRARWTTRKSADKNTTAGNQQTTLATTPQTATEQRPPTDDPHMKPHEPVRPHNYPAARSRSTTKESQYQKLSTQKRPTLQGVIKQTTNAATHNGRKTQSSPNTNHSRARNVTPRTTLTWRVSGLDGKHVMKLSYSDPRRKVKRN